MKKITKITIFMIMLVSLMSFLFACSPEITDVLTEDFEAEGLDLATTYKIVDGTPTDNTWTIGEVDNKNTTEENEGEKSSEENTEEKKEERWARVAIDFAHNKDNNNSRLELVTYDFTEFTGVYFDADFYGVYKWAIDGVEENNDRSSEGESTELPEGGKVIEGNYDLQVVVKVGDGDWKVVWHEKDDAEFLPKDYEDVGTFGKINADLSQMCAGKSDVTIGLWVVGNDANMAGVDNIHITATK